MESTSTEPQSAKDAVLLKSKKLPDGTPMVKGYDWNNGIDYDNLLNSYKACGFQATNFGKAIDEINKMVCDNTNIHWSKLINRSFSVRLPGNSDEKRRH